MTQGIPRFSIPVLFNMSCSVFAHGVELRPHQVQALRIDPNFCHNLFEPRDWLQTFTCIMTQTIANLTVLAGKLHYVTFGVITRNITRLSKTRISR